MLVRHLILFDEHGLCGETYTIESSARVLIRRHLELAECVSITVGTVWKLVASNPANHSRERKSLRGELAM